MNQDQNSYDKQSQRNLWPQSEIIVDAAVSSSKRKKGKKAVQICQY